jgi:hypothetical protein
MKIDHGKVDWFHGRNLTRKARQRSTKWHPKSKLCEYIGMVMFLAQHIISISRHIITSIRYNKPFSFKLLKSITAWVQVTTVLC